MALQKLIPLAIDCLPVKIRGSRYAYLTALAERFAFLAKVSGWTESDQREILRGRREEEVKTQAGLIGMKISRIRAL